MPGGCGALGWHWRRNLRPREHPGGGAAIGVASGAGTGYVVNYQGSRCSSCNFLFV
jgi:hypothetical protein